MGYRNGNTNGGSNNNGTLTGAANGLYDDSGIVKMGGPLVEDTDIFLQGKYLFAGENDLSTAFAIGDLTPLGGAPGTAAILASFIQFSADNDVDISADNDVDISADNDIGISADNDVVVNVGTNFYCATGNNYQSLANNFAAVGWYDGALELMQLQATSNDISLQNSDFGMPGFQFIYFKGNRGTNIVEMPVLPAFDYADDAAAAAAGIPVGGLYHNSGEMRVRIF